MRHSNRTTRTLHASVATVLCAALATTAVIAATPKLQIIDVTPNAKTISVGQKQSFTATGTFSDGSKQALGPDIANMATGEYYTCALLTSRGVECWGANSSGQLGNGTTSGSFIPRPVKGITTAVAVAAGNNACALLVTGAVKCWGPNEYGQLGHGIRSTYSTTPLSVAWIGTATAISVGYGSVCAVLSSGSVQCWGGNYRGQLGNGSNADSSLPVNVTGISTATAVAVGNDQSCAVLSSGSVQCWGNNNWGQLGNGTTTDSNTPVTVLGIGSATAIATGVQSSCALLASGAVQCWGWNAYGELGNGSDNTNSSVPVSVTGISTAVAITAGLFHYCVVLRSGFVMCWGNNIAGQLGSVTQNYFSTIPVRVGSINSPTKLVAGYQQTCALFSGGMMRCWGEDDVGQLGDHRTRYENPWPVTVIGTPGVVWNSSNSTKATINDRGIATGRAAGNTTITATTAGFINDNAVLTVK